MPRKRSTTAAAAPADSHQTAQPEAAPNKKSGKPRKETRTADGDGCLYFDAKRQLWVGTVMVGYKPSSKDPKKRVRDIRKVKAKRQDDCRRKLQQLRQDVTTGTLPEKTAKDNVGAFLERWLVAKQGTITERTPFTWLDYDPERPILHVERVAGTNRMVLEAESVTAFLTKWSAGNERWAARAVGDLMGGHTVDVPEGGFYFIVNEDDLTNQCYGLEPGPLKQLLIRECVIEGMVEVLASAGEAS